MFESHFQLSAPPFPLRPDPDAYFATVGHGRVIAYLKYGAYEGDGFIVVTGDVGAGKTTLVRMLLQQLDPDRIVAAQIVSTQLDPEDLLIAISAAFGVAPHERKGLTLQRLEVYLQSLAARGQRALLLVDEAQNLSFSAVEELRMLSNFQSDSTPLLQSFLIGQPELRRMLQDPSMKQFRQRVIASCHLGSMSEPETRQYIEHRLRRVGWNGRPHFEDASYGEIHRATDGIPRRINLVCSRLLLAAFLQSTESICPADVARIVGEMEEELSGESREPIAPAA